MSKAFVLASAFLLAGTAIGLSGMTALAAEAKSADAAKKDQCERDATLRLYVSEQKRSRFIRQCLASSGHSPGKAAASRMGVRPSAPMAVPKVTPLGGANSSGAAMGNTAPSNAAIAPSAPVVGSTGTSTTGSGATSITGSSGTSIGSSSGGL